jgi:hypothetical protein
MDSLHHRCVEHLSSDTENLRGWFYPCLDVIDIFYTSKYFVTFVFKVYGLS